MTYILHIGILDVRLDGSRQFMPPLGVLPVRPNTWC